DEFARKNAGYKIEWNAVGNEARNIKASLVENNPAGKKNGLSYYKEADIDDIATRKQIATEVRKNIHNIVRNADGSFTRTDLSNKQVAAAVALIEAGAKRMDMSISDYVSKTFGNSIFGNTEDFERIATAQGDTTGGKAGGVIQGVAQKGWQQLGQQVKAVIYAGENADFSTWAHELAHIFQAQLDGDLKEQAERAFNVINGDWINSKYTFKDGHVDSAAEAFAYGFQDWLKTGKAESEEMKNLFQKFAEFIARAFNALKEHINFTPEIEEVYNNLLSGNDSLLAQAEKAVAEEDRIYKANMKKQAEEKSASRKAAAEENRNQEIAEKEEESETTDFVKEPTAEELLEGSESEVKNETKEADTIIDNALEKLNVTDEQKNEAEEVLKNEASTVVDKGEVVTEVAESVYDENDTIPPDMFFQEEVKEVRKEYENTDKWMKAPNGEDSNLYENQWLQVRTPSFKKWFGDWENDPANASKVLDENGEPLVVYHGTDADFTIFDASKSRANMDIQGNFFSPWDIDAQGYGPNVRAFYLNIRNPANSSQGYSALNTYKGQNEAGIKARELLKSKGFDGVNNDNEEYIAFEPNQIKSATDNNGAFNPENPSILFQTVTDPELLEKLNSEPTVKVYRAMQVIDGEYYPPMATVVEGNRVESAKAGDWIQADEHPELAVPDVDPKTKKQKVDKDGNLKWKFVLDKGGKDSSGKPLTKIPAAYNPYWHTSRSPLNDQFSSAYKRPNLVTVEVEVPESELTSGYRAERAKDAVGEMDWHSGPVSSKLADKGNPRKVILSRYCKIVRVIPDEEVAQTIKGMLEGSDIAIPD
nr:hypothetical protein [Treponema sp.]